MSSEAPEGAREDAGGDGAAPLSLEEIQECDIREMAMDKFKSRQLQRSLSRGGAEHSNLVFSKAQPHIAEIVNDQHGNYLMQRIMEVINDDQFDIVFDLLKDNLITMAKDTHGTRSVQKIVEQVVARQKSAEAEDPRAEERVSKLVQALDPARVEELARDAAGFHVIVKLVESLPIDKAAALLEQICGAPEKVVKLGKDQWGCCVLKKCVDRSEGALKEKLIDSIAQHSLDLVQDAYGNYVVQHLIINDRQRPAGLSASNVGRVIDALKGHVFELSLQKYSSNVLEKCLAGAADKDRNKIINEILSPPNDMKPSEAVRKLLFHQYGNYVFQQSLEVAKDPQFSLLIEHSKQHIQELYIEASKQQGGRMAPGGADGNGSSGGKLREEHTQRLAVKLVKKYSALVDGMDMESFMPGMDAMDASSWMCGYDIGDPFGYGGVGPYPGFDAYGSAMFPFDPYSAAYGSYGLPFPAPTMGQAGKGRGSKKGKQSGQKGNGGKGTQSSATTSVSGETVRVGRIVGFWPNYEITYDEVPAGSNGGSTKRTGRNKAKGKAAPKKPNEGADASAA